MKIKRQTRDSLSRHTISDGTVDHLLDETGYDGWATAEVGGGGEEHLKKVSAAMDKVLGLG